MSRNSSFEFQLTNLSPSRCVRHYKGRRYIIHRDLYSAAWADMIAWHQRTAEVCAASFTAAMERYRK